MKTLVFPSQKVLGEAQRAVVTQWFVFLSFFTGKMCFFVTFSKNKSLFFSSTNLVKLLHKVSTCFSTLLISYKHFLYNLTKEIKVCCTLS